MNTFRQQSHWKGIVAAKLTTQGIYGHMTMLIV
jgi:hypothetical protein